MAETIAGAIREVLIAKIPGIQVYRNTSPANADLPLVVITDNIAVITEDLGDEIVLNEEVQIDVYQEYASISNLPDLIHGALHKAYVAIPSSHIHRCRVISRNTDIAGEGNDDGVERITFRVEIIRMLTSI
jgi:hypothetical protein